MRLTSLGIPKLWGEDPERLWRAMRYFIGPATAWFLACGSKAYGVERVPAEGGLVIASNHLSAIDPPLLGTFCPRGIYYMSKAELLATPIWGELLQWTGAFPIRRGEGDEEALGLARELVREGHAIGVYVEGTRQRFGYPGPARRGAMVVAMRESVPLVPVGLESFGWSFRNRRACAVVWGEPLDLSAFPKNETGFRDATALVRAELLRLWRQAAEAVVAGFPPELPDGTPRMGMVPPRFRWTPVVAPQRVEPAALTPA